jgi:C-terminal processing protease CtpA/Prc
VLPIEVHLDGERIHVLRTLAADVPLRPGDEIRAIDGRSTAEIRKRAFALLPGDGFIETGKERELEAGFAELYALLLDESPDGRFDVQTSGAAGPKVVRGISIAEYRGRRRPTEHRAVIESRRFEPDDVALLSVREFGDEPGQPRFAAELETFFRGLREKPAGHLVLDLRGNGGGRDQYGALLVSYLVSDPFGYFERIEVTAEYDGEGGVVERDGRRLVTEHSGLRVQQPAEQAFLGKLYVLIDGFTFSTAADVATVLHHLRRGVFLGEETGGGYDGNTSGASESVILPASGVRVNVPLWMYTTANPGHARRGRGVPADHDLCPSIEDAIAGRDVVLERALELARAD